MEPDNHIQVKLTLEPNSTVSQQQIVTVEVYADRRYRGILNSSGDCEALIKALKLGAEPSIQIIRAFNDRAAIVVHAWTTERALQNAAIEAS